jgi:hypothetical protein
LIIAYRQVVAVTHGRMKEMIAGAPRLRCRMSFAARMLLPMHDEYHRQITAKWVDRTLPTCAITHRRMKEMMGGAPHLHRPKMARSQAGCYCRRIPEITSGSPQRWFDRTSKVAAMTHRRITEITSGAPPLHHRMMVLSQPGCYCRCMAKITAKLRPSGLIAYRQPAP